MPEIALPGYRLDPGTDRDFEFLKTLFARTQAHMFEALPEPVKTQVLMQQFNARQDGYQRVHPDASDFVLKAKGAPIGRLLLDMSGDPFHIVDIAILPDFQGLGLGTTLLRSVCEAAKARGVDVVLSALEGERAQALYARNGFAVTARDGPHVTMRWTAG